MSKVVFKNYEKQVLEILVSRAVSVDKQNLVIENAEFVDYEYTGHGYFLTVKHPDLPQQRIVCDQPALMGKAEKIICGFVVFIEDSELTFECFSWGEMEIPNDFREKNVEVQEFHTNRTKR